MYVKRITSFCQVLKKDAQKRKLARFFCLTIYDTIRYDTIRDAILTCDRKLTSRVNLIYRTETTTKKRKTEKLKSKKWICSQVTVKVGGIRVFSPEEEKESLRWEGFAEKEGFKPGIITALHGALLLRN